MLDSILNQAGTGMITLGLKGMLLCSIASIALGIVIAATYMICSEKYSKNFVITLTVLPILVMSVIMMVNGNLGTGVAIVGAFSLIRFRSIPGTSKEIGTIFFAMATGLATGMGYIGFAAIITVLVGALMIVLCKTGFGDKKDETLQLKIVIPENLNFNGAFDDIFQKYTNKSKLDKVKTTNLGSMFELNYLVNLKKDADQKAMIDEIRVRNGNLTVAMGTVTPLTEEL